jgi:outer membrane protein TolC
MKLLHRTIPVLLLALAGCAGSLANQGITEISDGMNQTLGKQVVWVRSEEDADRVRERTGELLSRPLTADAAVELALLNNRELQAAFSEVGVGAADVMQARLPAAPGLTFSRRSRGEELEIERAITFNVLGLLSLPIRASIEQRNFEQTKLAVTQDVLRTAAQTRRAYYEAVAAAQADEALQRALDIASTRATLGKRLAETGNWSAFNYIREQAFYSETAITRAKARFAAVAARERLARLMGIHGENLSYKLPERLPDLPEVMDETSPDAESDAVRNRLDIRMARSRVDQLAWSLGLTQATRLVDVLEVGLAEKRETGQEQRQRGYEINIEVPIFDFGESKVARAEAIYLQGVNRLADLAIKARSEVRLATLNRRNAFEFARQYRTEILPMRQRISEELVYRYNGMLASVFELLADSRDQLLIVMDAIEAERDYWIAETDLKFAALADTGMSSGRGVRPSARSAGPAGH